MINVAFLSILYLLAAPNTNSKDSSSYKGRQRYDPKKGAKNSKKKKNSKNGNKQFDEETMDQELPTPPPPTNAEGPFPTYFTCRHTYEDTLMEEITRTYPLVEASSPYPGLVRIKNMQEGATVEQKSKNNVFYEPVYALQELRDCRIVEVPNSIKGLARAITELDNFVDQLDGAPRASLSVHALVMGMCKGQKDPVLQRRSQLVAAATVEMLQTNYAAARKLDTKNGAVVVDDNDEQWLLQILLLSPDVAAVSLAQCQRIPTFPNCVWPNPKYPLGLAKVDINDVKMPSSAYRKLLEALACWGIPPLQPGEHCVDLGASPGGWTAALLLLCQGCRVIAVDRAKLDPRMMNNLLVHFVKGDAFTYRPSDTLQGTTSVKWMVSDIIAYPERVTELLDMWCGDQLAEHMIVTVKFQGATPSWDDLNDALQVARRHGYVARAKHFFNNKNEVTVMVQKQKGAATSDSSSSIATMYEMAWPKSRS